MTTPLRRSRSAPGGKLTLLPLVMATFFMVSGGPYGIEDILGGAGYAGALAILLILPFFWSVPTALMIGELASAIPADGGFYVWVRRALGPFWGFQEAWLSLAASIFDMAIYPALFVAYLGRLAPALNASHRGTLWALAAIALCAGWNLLGAKPVGQGAVWMFFLLMAPFVILCGYAVHQGLHAAAAPAPCTGSGFGTALLVALWNYMGWDNASTVAQEVDDPQRNYPRGVLLCVALVALCYAVPLGAIRVAGLDCANFRTGAWADAATTLAGRWLGLAIIAGGTLSAIGMLNSLMMSYARVPFAMAQDRLLPQIFARTNRRGVPWVSLLVCAAGWALAAQMSFERLISIDILLYGTSLILEFVALVALRRREPELRRPFRAGSFGMAVLLGVFPTALIVYAAYLSRAERMAGMPSLAFAGTVALGGPLVFLASAVARRRKQPAPSAP